MTECKLCNGVGQFKHIIQRNNLKQRYTTVIDWCVCMKAKLVSESTSLTLLAGLGDAYLPLEHLDPQLFYDMENPGKTPNYLIQSDTSYDTFLLQIKSFVIKNKFKDPAPFIYACDSIDLLKRFYVAQDDKTCPGLAALSKYDLLIFTMGVDEKNEQLNTCVSQVVSNRKGLKRPTWIYLKKKYDACIWEKSEILSGYLKESYKEINLKSVGESFKKTHSKVKKLADNFKL